MFSLSEWAFVSVLKLFIQSSMETWYCCCLTEISQSPNTEPCGISQVNFHAVPLVIKSTETNKAPFYRKTQSVFSNSELSNLWQPFWESGYSNCGITWWGAWVQKDTRGSEEVIIKQQWILHLVTWSRGVELSVWVVLKWAGGFLGISIKGQTGLPLWNSVAVCRVATAL